MKKIFNIIVAGVFVSFCTTAQAEPIFHIPFYNTDIKSPTFASFSYDPIRQDLICTVKNLSSTSWAKVNWKQGGKTYSQYFRQNQPAVLHNTISKETLWIDFSIAGSHRPQDDRINVSCYYRAHQ